MQPTIENELRAEIRVANEGASTAVAYLLWFFLGSVSAPRFYLGRVGLAFRRVKRGLHALSVVVLALFALTSLTASPAAAHSELQRELTIVYEESTGESAAGYTEEQLIEWLVNVSGLSESFIIEETTVNAAIFYLEYLYGVQATPPIILPPPSAGGGALSRRSRCAY